MCQTRACGLRERSQFGGGGFGAGGRRDRLFGIAGIAALAQQFGAGAVPGSFEGGDLALDAGEQFGGGRFAEQGCGEGCAGRFGEEGAVEIRLYVCQAALLPIGAQHGFHVEEFRGGIGAEFAVIVCGKGAVGGGIFAGDDDRSGVDREVVRGGKHAYEVARRQREIAGGSREVIDWREVIFADRM